VIDTRGVIEAIFAEAAKGDLDGVMRWWAADGILEDVSLARAFRGHDEIREYLDWYYRALPDVRYEPIRLVIDGPTAMVEWAQPATIVEPFDGTGVGKTLYLHALDVFHVQDGLIQHECGWYGDMWLRHRLEGTGDPPPELGVPEGRF
jgi:hypothetical protein